MSEWQPIETAPKDGTPVLLCLRPDLVERFDPDRSREGAWSLERWAGLRFVGRHPGIREDFDIGWSFAAPVGQGGFPDQWFSGWLPIPDASPTLPTPDDATREETGEG